MASALGKLELRLEPDCLIANKPLEGLLHCHKSRTVERRHQLVVGPSRHVELKKQPEQEKQAEHEET